MRPTLEGCKEQRQRRHRKGRRFALDRFHRSQRDSRFTAQVTPAKVVNDARHLSAEAALYRHNQGQIAVYVQAYDAEKTEVMARLIGIRPRLQITKMPAARRANENEPLSIS